MPTSVPTVLAVPCFSGAPWDLAALEPLRDYPLRTLRLPEGVDDVELYADHVAESARELDSFVLMGDSFGAVVALALAVRAPARLKALVLSGGFASNPVEASLDRAKIHVSRFLPGAAYRGVVLNAHAAALASPFDLAGEHPLPKDAIRDLFVTNTPWRNYTARAKAAFTADYSSRLQDIRVPTLILTPEHDTLIGPRAGAVLRETIPDAEEHVLPATGHMFRFTHPRLYSEHVARFLDSRLRPAHDDPRLQAAAG